MTTLDTGEGVGAEEEGGGETYMELNDEIKSWSHMELSTQGVLTLLVTSQGRREDPPNLVLTMSSQLAVSLGLNQLCFMIMY